MPYVEPFHRGYALLDIDHERTQAELYHAESNLEANNTNQLLAAAFVTLDARNYLVPVSGPSSKKNRCTSTGANNTVAQTWYTVIKYIQ